MMGVAFDYRLLAADQRRQADATPLLMVRMIHLSSAEKWERLAEEIERFEPVPASDPSQDFFY